MQESMELSVPKRSSSYVKRDSIGAAASDLSYVSEESKVDRKDKS